MYAQRPYRGHISHGRRSANGLAAGAGRADWLVTITAVWGIHLTGASARRAGNSPWSVRRRAFQAGWVPTGSRRRRWLHFGCGVNDEVSVAHRVVRDGELEHPVEHHPAAAGAAAVEAAHELIQVAGQVRGVDRALVRAQQPPLDQ